MHQAQPWKPADATRCLNALGQIEDVAISFQIHAQERLIERGLLFGDVLHVLKYGFIHLPSEPATRPNFFKYRVTTTTPNSEKRSIALVVIPDPKALAIKLVTVMWQDET